MVHKYKGSTEKGGEIAKWCKASLFYHFYFLGIPKPGTPTMWLTGPPLAGGEQHEGCVERQELEILVLVHLCTVRLKHHRHRHITTHTQLVLRCNV